MTSVQLMLCRSWPGSLYSKISYFCSIVKVLMTHGVIGNTSDFGSAESWFEPRWVNKRSESESESGEESCRSCKSCKSFHMKES